MKDKMLEQRIQQSLNAELSGLNTTSWQRDQYCENATGGTKVKRKLTVGLVFAIVFKLLDGIALSAKMDENDKSVTLFLERAPEQREEQEAAV